LAVLHVTEAEASCGRLPVGCSVVQARPADRVESAASTCPLVPTPSRRLAAPSKASKSPFVVSGDRAPNAPDAVVRPVPPCATSSVDAAGKKPAQLVPSHTRKPVPASKAIAPALVAPHVPDAGRRTSSVNAAPPVSVPANVPEKAPENEPAKVFAALPNATGDEYVPAIRPPGTVPVEREPASSEVSPAPLPVKALPEFVNEAACAYVPPIRPPGTVPFASEPAFSPVSAEPSPANAFPAFVNETACE